jgi:hypothetical protein
MAEPRNPYRTAPGSDPPELAGRAGELGAARYAIRMAQEGEPPKPIVFTGLRGLGKTALLRQVARDARAAGGVALVGEADASLRFADVMRRELLGALERSEPLPARLRGSIGKIVASLPKISYELPHGAGGIALESHAEPDQDAAIAGDALEDVLLTLNDRLGAHQRFLAIGLDEIQDSPRTDLLRIIRAVHKTAGTDHPILFVGAGLPDTAAVLRAVRTYTERWAYFRLALLTRTETEEAVDVPARHLGVHWEQSAVDELYARSLGYPYFVQEFASAAWLHREGAVITRDDVRAVSVGVQKMLDESFYDRQFDQLTPREAVYVLALHGLGSGVHHAREIADALDMRSELVSSVRTQLIKKDVIYSAGRGLTEFRVPLTNEYIERRMADIVRRAGVSPLVRAKKAKQ